MLPSRTSRLWVANYRADSSLFVFHPQLAGSSLVGIEREAEYMAIARARLGESSAKRGIAA